MRKEYQDRQNAPLINPGITAAEYEANRTADSYSPKPVLRVVSPKASELSADQVEAFNRANSR